MEIKELNGVLYYSGVGLPDNNVRPEVESVFFYINEETQKKYVWTINRISGVGNWIELGDTLKFIIFDELPEPSEEYSTTIALILNPTSPESEDEYDEYACIYNNELRAWEWEKLNSHVRFWSNYYYDADGDLILSKQESKEIIIHHPEEGHWEKQNTVVWIGDTTDGGTLGEGWTPTTNKCSITTTASYLKDQYKCAYRTSDSGGHVKFNHEQLTLSESDEITFVCWHGSNTSARDIYLYINDERVATFTQPKSSTESNTFVYVIPEDKNIESVRIQSSGASGFMTYEVRYVTNVWVVDTHAWDETITLPPSLTIGDSNESDANINIVGGTLTFNGSKIMLWEKTGNGGYVLDKDVTNVSADGSLGVAHGNSTHANGNSSHAEGTSTTTIGVGSHTEGFETRTEGDWSHAEGRLTQTIAGAQHSHAEGNVSIARGAFSHAEGTSTNANGEGAHAEGLGTFATGNWSHAEGNDTNANGTHSHAEGNGTTASGAFSHAEGTSTSATVEGAHAEGQNTIASGIWSHTEGQSTTASGIFSHAEGQNTTAIGSWSHAEGNQTRAEGNWSHTEGQSTTASGALSHAEGKESRALAEAAHAEGSGTYAYAPYSHAEGQGSQAHGSNSHAEGGSTAARGTSSHAEGNNTNASADYSHAEGNATTASGMDSHAEGNLTRALSNHAHAEGSESTASNTGAHAEGGSTTASGQYSHAEGGSTTASGQYSHAEGQNTTASNSPSHAEGANTTASGPCSHAEGNSSIAAGNDSHAEGYNTRVGGYEHGPSGPTPGTYSADSIGEYAHAEGNATIAKGNDSHAEGKQTLADGYAAHAEGTATVTRATAAHAEGNATTALGNASHAEGVGTKTQNISEHAEGSYNTTHRTSDTYGNGGNTQHSIGIGAEGEGNNKNAVEVMQNGDFYMIGVGNYQGTDTKVQNDTIKTLQQVVNGKQDILTAGQNIEIINNTITAKGYEFYGATDGGFAEKYKQDSSDGGQILNNTATGLGSHAEGYKTTASGDYGSHAEGCHTIASYDSAHAEGFYTIASGDSSHAEGQEAKATSNYAHAEGKKTNATNFGCHAEGFETTAQNVYEHAEGTSNYSHKANGSYGDAGNTQHSIGIGGGFDTEADTRKNAFEIMQNGDMYVLGVGGYQGTNTKVQDATIKTLQQVINEKQVALEEGDNIDITNNVISVVGIIDDSDASISSTYSSTKIESIVDGIHQIITDDEEVVSAALNDLKIDITRIESECEGAIKSITVNGTRVEADSDHNVELTAGTLTLTDADNKTLGWFTANSTALIQIPEATSSEYGFVKVDNTLDSTSTNPVENRVITSAISSLVGIRCEVVSELPATGENGVIYFVPNDGSEPNIYDEYIWIDSTSRFELIGTTEIDLSNYVTRDDLNTTLLNYVSETELTNILNNYVTDSEFDNLIEDVNIQLSDIDRELSTKQDKLTEGYGIDIIGNTISVESDFVTESELNERLSHYLTDSDGYVISSSINELYDTKQDKLIEGYGIDITGNVISVESDFVTESELDERLSYYLNDSDGYVISSAINELYDTKQDKLTAGNNITISNDGVISADVPTVGAGNLNIKINQSGTVSPVSDFNANQDSDEDIIFSAGSNVTLSASGNTITISATGGGTVGTLNTTNTTSLSPQSGESLSGTIDLHKISKTGSYSDLIGAPTLATVATSGSYNDLSNKPTIPAAQVNADWNASSGVAEILNKPTLATVATSGSYNDLSNKPTIPAAQVNADWNASSGVEEILNKPTLATVATSGSYNDLSNKPTIPTVGDGSLHIKVDQSGSDIDVIDFNANQDSSDDITFVAGSNITLTPDTTNKTITIAATGGGTSGIDITVPSDNATYPILLGNTDDGESDVTSIQKSIGLVVNPNKKSVAEGNTTTALGNASHAEGQGSLVQLSNSNISERAATTITFSTLPSDIKIGSVIKDANGAYAKVTNIDTSTNVVTVNSNLSTDTGTDLYLVRGIAYDGISHAEGSNTTASGPCSHAEGNSTIASGECSHAESYNNNATGDYSHAEGGGTTASNYAAHAEGNDTVASNISAHAEGGYTKAKGTFSHAEGNNTIASGIASHASGQYTVANRDAQTVVGKYNDYNDENLTNALFVVGNGTQEESRSNAFYVKDNGDVYADGAYYAAAAYYAASDKRKKDIIGDIDLEKAYSLLEACQTVTYTWKDDESKKQQIGVIAQEIQQFFPEIVNEDEHGMLSVDYSRLTVILMSVIKNNIKEMKSLEERIKLLEEKNK